MKLEFDFVLIDILGHKDPKMVQRYAHHSVESLRKGIEVLETSKKLSYNPNQSQFSHS